MLYLLAAVTFAAGIGAANELFHTHCTHYHDDREGLTSGDRCLAMEGCCYDHQTDHCESCPNGECRNEGETCNLADDCCQPSGDLGESQCLGGLCCHAAGDVCDLDSHCCGAATCTGPGATCEAEATPATCCTEWSSECYDTPTPDNFSLPCSLSNCASTCNSFGASHEFCHSCCSENDAHGMQDAWKCPNDCQVTENWSGWSPCWGWNPQPGHPTGIPVPDDPACVGESKRFKTVIKEARHGGADCGDILEVVTCLKTAGQCAHAVIDSLAMLQGWCNQSLDNCLACKGSYDGTKCNTKPAVIAKCRKFKGNAVCDRIKGCRSVTNKKGKTKCKGRKHGLA